MMQKKVLEIACSDSPRGMDAQWAEIRRGWYFGAEAFRTEMLDRLDEVIGFSGKRESFSAIVQRGTSATA